MSTAARIRAELLVGPMTSAECAAVLELPLRLVSAHLSQLHNAGHVAIYGEIKNNGTIPVNIFQLAERGRFRAIFEAQKTKPVHNVPVNAAHTEPEMRPLPMISGAERPNKTLKPVPAAPCTTGQQGVLQTTEPGAARAMSATGVTA
jgi:hypothetical protein